MSRRGRHGRHPQPHSAARAARAAGQAPDAPSASRLAPVTESIEILMDPLPAAARPTETITPEGDAAARSDDREREHLRPAAFRSATAPEVRAPSNPAGDPEPGRSVDPVTPPAPVGHGDVAAPRPGCTVAQLRRFIKSRPWVPMHELRRRFGIAGAEDEVTPVRVGERTLFLGLPGAEARMVAELLGGGDVGFELSLDPDVPVVVGVYPMRPVPRS